MKIRRQSGKGSRSRKYKNADFVFWRPNCSFARKIKIYGKWTENFLFVLLSFISLSSSLPFFPFSPSFSLSFSSPLCVFLFWDSISLWSLNSPGTLFVDKPGLEPTNLPASASPGLKLKACTLLPTRNNYSFIKYLLLTWCEADAWGASNEKSSAQWEN